MILKHQYTLIWVLLLNTANYSLAHATSEAPSQCTEVTNIIPILDRPSQAYSACPAPEHTMIVESGYNYANLVGGGSSQDYPETFLRVGVSKDTEINFGLPNYNYQTIEPHSGFNASFLGIKHIIGENKKWLVSMESFLLLPSGSAAFGNRTLGEEFDGIVNYSFNDELSILGMLGISSQTTPIDSGGRRYTSVNPDVVLSWNKDKIDFYGELYGQSKISPDQGSGFNMDAGVLYAIRKNVVVDFSIGQRISGVLFGFNHYIATGISLQFM